jgi:hypothetical protein
MLALGYTPANDTEFNLMQIYDIQEMNTLSLNIQTANVLLETGGNVKTQLRRPGHLVGSPSLHAL